MNDASVITGQLTRLREKLEQKELELGQLSEQSELERARSIQFITRLMQACRGHDRELDNRLAKLRQRFEENQPIHLLASDLLAVEKLLQNIDISLEESLRANRQQLKEGGRTLGALRQLPDKLRREAKELQNDSEGQTLTELQGRIARLMDLYQQAIRNLLLSKDTPLPALEVTPDQETTEYRSLDPQMHARICDELQRLITELDFTGPVGEQLSEIRRNLLTGVEATELPALCLELVELVIEGARQERRESHLFLASLNDSLSSVHLQFSESMESGLALHEQGVSNSQHLHRHIEDIHYQLNTASSLEDLKVNIEQNMTLIQALLQERQGFHVRERELLDEMVAMESRLNQLKDETAEYKKRMAQQKHKLLLDSLTQVYNRAALDERLDLEFKRWQRYQSPLGLAIIDIDFFKSINDRFGHLAGDKALKVIARAMSRALRETDFIARYGGEEFVVLLPGIDADSFLAPLEKIRAVVKSIPFRFKDDKVEITVSMGATLLKEGDKPSDAFERADRALYEAKNHGRDRIIYRS